MKPLYNKLLPKLGVVDNPLLSFHYGSEKYFGFGLPDIHIYHVIAKLNIFIVHFTSSTLLGHRTPTLLGQHIQHTTERLQLEVSIDTPFFHLPYIQYGISTTPCWLGHLWEQISDTPVRIECRKQPIMGLQRVGDEYIMATILDLNKYTKSEVLSIKNVRIVLRCYSLADLHDGSCTKLQRFVFKLRQRNINSSYTWPQAKPCWIDYQLWMEAITTILPFKQLGAWFK